MKVLTLITQSGEARVDIFLLGSFSLLSALIRFFERTRSCQIKYTLTRALNPPAYVKRDGIWSKESSSILVPGDLIQLREGDVIPADATLLTDTVLLVDETAVTGDFFPVRLYQNGRLKRGACVLQGKGEAIVSATGLHTLAGQAITITRQLNGWSSIEEYEFPNKRYLPNKTGPLPARKVVHRVRVLLITLASLLALGVFTVLYFSTSGSSQSTDETPPDRISTEGNPYFTHLAFCLTLLIAASSPTFASAYNTIFTYGTQSLLKRNVIASSATTIETIANMSLLCTDVTSSITTNEYRLVDQRVFGKDFIDSLIVLAMLACQDHEESFHPLEAAVAQNLTPEARSIVDTYEVLRHYSRKTLFHHSISTVRGLDNQVFHVAYGNFFPILDLCDVSNQVRVDALAYYRTNTRKGAYVMAVAANRAGGTVDGGGWAFVGVLVFSCHVQPGARYIPRLVDYGVEVKLIGDCDKYTLRELTKDLGMGATVLDLQIFQGISGRASLTQDAMILQSNGMSSANTATKRFVVESLAQQNRTLGLTVETIDDLACISTVDLAIAVDSAIDALRVFADVILLEPGIETLLEAILQARRVMQRVWAYCVFKCISILHIVLTSVAFTLMINPTSEYFFGRYHEAKNPNGGVQSKLHASGVPVYPDAANDSAFVLPLVALLVLSLSSDVLLIGFLRDKTAVDRNGYPAATLQSRMSSLLLSSFATLFSTALFGVLLLRCNSTHPESWVGRLFGSDGRPYVRWSEAKTLVFYKILCSDLLSIFSARTCSHFLERKTNYKLLGTVVFTAFVGTLIAAYWGDVLQYPGMYMASLRRTPKGIAGAWIYAFISFLIQDGLKSIVHFLRDKQPDRIARQTNEILRRSILTQLINEERESLADVDNNPYFPPGKA